MKTLFLPAFLLAVSLNTAYADSFSFTQNKFIEDHTKDFSKNSEQNEILNRYKKFEKLFLIKKELFAADILLPEELKQYSLKEKEKIFLDKTNIGILVSCPKRTLFLIPSDIKYSDTSARSDRF